MRTSSDLVDWLEYLTHDDLALLKDTVANLPFDNPRIVNIGAGAGTSGLAIMESRADAQLATIDITDKSSPFGCLEAEREVLAENGYPSSGQSHHQIHARSQDVGREWEKYNPWDEPDVHLVFVDGDHSRDGVQSDIDVWLPRLAPGGVILFHDYKKIDSRWRRFPDEKAKFDLMNVQQQNRHVGKVIKPFPGVDEAVDETMLKAALHIATVDSLISFMV